jgi:asparagine synthase (glutamine-hydrolysing)
MCGISGVLSTRVDAISKKVLLAMSDALYHRGPDDSGLWIDNYVGLAHRRLAIRDLSEDGRQPKISLDGNYVITYNGEIYNDSSIKKELAKSFDLILNGRCDTEILPNGYSVWQDSLFNKIEGIYALAIWDKRNETLILARDHIGTKPLYYFIHENSFYFASEIKAILAAIDFCPSFDCRSLHKFFAQGYVSPNETTLEGVYQVEPGTIIKISRNNFPSIKKHKFFHLNRTAKYTCVDDALSEFIPLWEKVLNEQIVSDVPIGILQSGGIDSSLITYGINNKKKIPLFTASFKESSHDETSLAKTVASSNMFEHHQVKIEDVAADEEVFKKVVWAFDGQVADNSAFAFFKLASTIKKHVTVALTGDGADELFAGYPTYTASILAKKINPLFFLFVSENLLKYIYSISSTNESTAPSSGIFFRTTSFP